MKRSNNHRLLIPALMLCLFFASSRTSANNYILPDSSVFYPDTQQLKEPEIFDRAEVLPVYPGGPAELMKFLKENVQYPPEARQNGAEGKVIVRFYIDVDGTVQEPWVIKDGVGHGCAAEAVRVILAMPKWTPGSQRGKAVRVYYVLPITFKLTGEEPLVPAKFPGGEAALNAYKNNIIVSIKKPKKEQDVAHRVEILFTLLETGKVEHAVVTLSTTRDNVILDQLLQGVLKMPKWSPEVYAGKPRTSVQEITFIF